MSRGPRFGVAALAVGITAALLSALEVTHVDRIGQGPVGKVMVWLPPLSPAASAATEQEKDQAARPTRRLASTGLRRSAPEQIAVPPAGVLPAPEAGESLAPVPEAPGRAATLNLQLRDVDARAGGSSLRSVAEKAGTYMGDERLSEQGRLARSVSRAGKADCLASNERGSLLSIVRIAYDAVTDKCK